MDLRLTFRHFLGMAIIGTSLALAGCGGGGGGSDDDDDSQAEPAVVTFSGTAATGAPIDGTVEVVNANGEMADNPVDINEDGTFSISVSSGSPYLFEVTDSEGNTLYSYAVSGGTVNVTPMTNLAVVIASGGDNPMDLFTNWSNSAIDPEEVEEAAETIEQNFMDLYAANGVDPEAYDFFYDEFEANGSQIDAVLDSLEISYNFNQGTLEGTISVEVNQNPVVFNYSVDTTEVETSEPTGSGEIPADSVWTLTITGTSSGVPINQTIEVQGQGVPAAEQDVEAASQDVLSGSLETQGLSITYSYDNISINSSVNGSVGDTVDIDVVGQVQIQGEVQGQAIDQNASFDLHYHYERIQ